MAQDDDFDFGVEDAEVSDEFAALPSNHNGGPEMLEFEGEEIGGVVTEAAKGRMRTLVERIERIQEEKDEAAEAMKNVYSEAKGEGFDTKVLRKVIARRKQDRIKREEEQALIELYEAALEMIAP